MAEVILCRNCKHFKFVTGMVTGLCDNEKALPFPGPSDFCSHAERGGEFDAVQVEKDLLAKVYAQRR